MYSAPWIRPPLAQGCTRVVVDGCVPLPLNEVVLRIDGVPIPAYAVTSETMILPVPTLGAMAVLTVTQGPAGAQSGPSDPLTVLKVPDPLPPPEFETVVYNTTGGVLMTHLLPGSTVTLTTDDQTRIGSATADGASVVVPLDAPNSELSLPGRLHAVATRPGQAPSEAVSSTAMIAPPTVAPKTLAPPVLGEALECARSVPVFNSYPGASVVLDPAGKRDTFVMPYGEGNLIVDRLVAGATVSAVQRFDVQEWNDSQPAGVTVVSKAPPPPTVTGAICPLRDTDVLVSGIGGALVHLRATGSPDDLLTRVVDLGSGVCRLRVPAALAPTGTESMQVVQALCSRESTPATVPVLTAPPLIPGPPVFPFTLFACSRVVAVSGLVAGTTVSVVSDAIGVIGSVLATGPDAEIQVWPVLIAGDALTLVGQACSGSFGDPGKVEVKKRPSPSQLQFVPAELWDGGKAVGIAGITPGSRVDLYVGDVLAGWADVATANHTFAVPPLHTGQVLRVQQHDCQGPEDRVVTSDPVKAQVRLTLDVKNSDPARQVTAGLATYITAKVTDADTGQEVAIDVQIGNQPPVTIPSNQSAPITLAKSGSVSCATVATPGHRSTTKSLTVHPLMPVAYQQIPPNSDPALVVNVTGSTLRATFADEPGASFEVTVGPPGVVKGAAARTGIVLMTLDGSVTYRPGTQAVTYEATTSGNTTHQLPPDKRLVVLMQDTEQPPGTVDWKPV